MTIKITKTPVDASLKPPRTQEILGVFLNRGTLTEIKKDANPEYSKGEIDG